MSSLTVRKLNSTDYENILVGWWNDWGWTPPAKDFLPESGEGGIIVYIDEEPICAGFMYITNSSVAWVDWIISSRTYREKILRRVALKTLIERLTHACSISGSKYIYALLKNQSLIKVYEEEGYAKSEGFTTEMIKRL
jgi:hypothetical protein